MNKIIQRTALFTCLLFGLLSSSCVYALPEPSQLVNDSISEMLHNLNANRQRINTEKALLYRLVDDILLPHVDFTEMSRKVLATEWRRANARQKQSFKETFQTLVVQTYAEALLSYTDQKVKILDQRRSRSNPNLVEVRTLILQNGGPDIAVNYRLIHRKDKWKVYDMKVEGVSLVSNFRSQFKEKIRELGMDGLIEDIRQHNRRGQ